MGWTYVLYLREARISCRSGWSETLPTDGSRKIVEAFISDDLLERTGDKRVGKVAEAKKKGLYKAVSLRDPGEEGWIGLGAFD